MARAHLFGNTAEQKSGKTVKGHKRMISIRESWLNVRSMSRLVGLSSLSDEEIII